MLPVTHTERTYSVFVALIGVVTFAFAMGNITTLMATTRNATASSASINSMSLPTRLSRKTLN